MNISLDNNCKYIKLLTDFFNQSDLNT